MSADNAIFIFNINEEELGVVHYTWSPMPYDIPELIENGKTVYGEELFRFRGKNRVEQANKKATAIAIQLRSAKQILEYGIIDWTEYDWETDVLKADLFRLISDESLNIYTVVVMARADLQNGDVIQALGRLYMDMDKFYCTHHELYSFLMKRKQKSF